MRMELLKHSKACQLPGELGVSLACTAQELALLPLTFFVLCKHTLGQKRVQANKC